jgi:histone H3/H4
MESITRPSIIRLARKAGVKSVSEECFHILRQIIDDKLHEILSTSLIVNSEHQTKTLMSDDIYSALYILGENVTQSNDLSTSSCIK